MNEFTAIDVLKIIEQRAQFCRKNGESDMRNILDLVRFLRQGISSGKSREQIINEFVEDEE